MDVPTGAKGDPTFSSIANSSLDAAHQSPWPEPIEHTEASPSNPKSFGLRALGGPQPDEGSSVPKSKKQSRQYSHVVESLRGNLDLIPAGFHIGRYVTASVNTEAEWEQIKALYSSMKTTLELIDVSIFTSSYLCVSKFDSLLMQAVVKHSQDKDQFLKVSIKMMQEAQMFEDELKEANVYNSVLFTWLQELEAKLAEESQLKNGKFLLPLYLENHVISEYTLD
jgi:hypothetical protein